MAIYFYILENPNKSMLPIVNESELYPSQKYSLANKLKPLWQIGESFPENIDCKRGSEPEGTDLANVPSVTRILNETMPVEQKMRLQAWEEKMVYKMGRSAFEKMQELIMKRGHRLHSAIGKYFQNVKISF